MPIPQYSSVVHKTIVQRRACLDLFDEAVKMLGFTASNDKKKL